MLSLKAYTHPLSTKPNTFFFLKSIPKISMADLHVSFTWNTSDLQFLSLNILQYICIYNYICINNYICNFICANLRTRSYGRDPICICVCISQFQNPVFHLIYNFWLINFDWISSWCQENIHSTNVHLHSLKAYNLTILK